MELLLIGGQQRPHRQRRAVLQFDRLRKFFQNVFKFHVSPRGQNGNDWGRRIQDGKLPGRRNFAMVLCMRACLAILMVWTIAASGANVLAAETNSTPETSSVLKQITPEDKHY